MVQLALLLLLVLVAIWNLVAGIVLTAILVAVLVWAGTEAQRSPLERQIIALRRARKGRK